MNILQPTPRDHGSAYDAVPDIVKPYLRAGLRLPKSFVDELSKHTVAELMLPDSTEYDTALPQNWLNNFSQGLCPQCGQSTIDDDALSAYHTVRQYTVWAYVEGNFWGEPFPLTVEAEQLITKHFNNK